ETTDPPRPERSAKRRRSRLQGRDHPAARAGPGRDQPGSTAERVAERQGNRVAAHRPRGARPFSGRGAGLAGADEPGSSPSGGKI
ncbi:MAG: hypothetical protein AVDCRST_MAG90-2129, partial [uncultured Microvirga sp.]